MASSKRAWYAELMWRAYREAVDPWAEVSFPKPERVRRHRSETDETLAKMEGTPFARGGVRVCFRVKKLSQQPGRHRYHALEWRKANNYVAKRNVSGSDEATIRQEVMLQQICGRIGRVYNELGPPKQIEILDCFVMEFFQRPPDDPRWYLCERYVAGQFEKHNTNQGSVESERLTPQAFTAASFWLTRGESMVTDIQGVDDLYTDPCLHTLSGIYGSTDLGCRGMALFFETCDDTNPLFTILGIPKFQLAPSQRRRPKIDTSSSTSQDLWRSATSLPGFKKRPPSELRDEDIDALERALDAADRAATAALSSSEDMTLEEDDDESLESLDVAVENLRKVNLRAVARIHAAFAELETEGYFSGGEPDVAAALFHCAKAASKGSAVAAHALARWHADLPAGALCPRYTELRYAYPAKSGPLLVLAAKRGDVSAAVAAADAYLCPRYGLPMDKKKARDLLELARDRWRPPQDGHFLQSLNEGDQIMANLAARGFPMPATILRIHDDGTVNLKYDANTEEHRVPWSRVLGPPDLRQRSLPPGAAGADVPGIDEIIARIADLDDSDDLRRKAADLALQWRAPARAQRYLEKVSKVKD